MVHLYFAGVRCSYRTRCFHLRPHVGRRQILFQYDIIVHILVQHRFVSALPNMYLSEHVVVHPGTLALSLSGPHKLHFTLNPLLTHARTRSYFICSILGPVPSPSTSSHSTPRPRRGLMATPRRPPPTHTHTHTHNPTCLVSSL